MSRAYRIGNTDVGPALPDAKDILFAAGSGPRESSFAAR
jgi:hypothetical protein